MKKIKVLHLTSTRYGIGGVEKLLLDMSDKYDNDMFEVSYCNLFCDNDGQGAFPSELRKRGLKIFEVNGRRWSDLPVILRNLLSILSSEQFHVVHLHMLQATIVGMIAAKLGRTRTVVTKHYTPGPSHTGIGTPTGRRVVQTVDSHLTRRADRIVAVSEYVRDALLRSAVPAGRLGVIYNGIDLVPFASLRDRIHATAGGHLVIGSVGSLIKVKSHETLLEAFSDIVRDYPECRLQIVGEGPEREALTTRCERLGISSRVEFMGFRQDVPVIMSTFDVYVQTSLHESFGMVLLEAMAAGNPVIATRVGGMPEIVVPGETGFLVPAGDPVELSKALRILIDSHERRKEMGEKGRALVNERFTIEKTVRAYEDLYVQLLRN